MRTEGGAGTAYLERAISEVERKANGEWARVIGEPGSGIVPNAWIQGNVMTDAKASGSIHLTIGQNPAPLHLECVVSQPALRPERVVIPALDRT